MISFVMDEGRFDLRVAGVTFNNGKVLLHRFEGYDFWAVPGGRAELFEDTRATVHREMKEELKEDITVNRLLWCCENFFTLDEIDIHQICFYYLISLDPESTLIEEQDIFELPEIDGTIMTFKWFDLEQLNDINVVPKFLKERLKNLPMTLEHIVERIRVSKGSCY